MKISLIIPAFNEEAVIGNTLSQCLDFLKANFCDYELIAVNDGSRDRTADIIRSFSDVICISYGTNRGKGYAVKRGFLRATGDYIFFTDADLSYSLGNIPKALELFRAKSICGVMGVRSIKGSNYPYLRRIFSRRLNRLLRLTLGISVPDSQCGFKALDKKTARDVFARSQIFGFGFDFEVLYLLKAMQKPLALLPLSFVHRTASHVRLFSDTAKILKSLIDIKLGRRGLGARG